MMRILVVDDDPRLRGELASFLGLSGHEVEEASCLAAARGAMTRAGDRPDLVLADLWLGEERGDSLLDLAEEMPIVMISGAAGVREAVSALKSGAWDFLEKPVDPDRLLGLVRNLQRSLDAERRAEGLRAAWLREHAAWAPGSPFGEVLEEARRVASSPLSVLVTGPSGAGKEIVARWIHFASPRSGGPFVAVNCAAVQGELAEAAFFGARKGAYTGADSDRQGWFQAASGGTLFLDEIGEIAPALQAKLLRAVESGEVQRLGSNATESVSVRIVSATNRDLDAEVLAGRFREDLLWRLAQARLDLPPLSGRRMDVPVLAAFFLAKAREGSGGDLRFSAEALDWLAGREWPGNVRELRALVERAAWLSPGPEIGVGDLVELDGGKARAAQAGAGSSGRAGAALPGSLDAVLEGTAVPGLSGPALPLREAKAAFERAYVEAVLEASGGSVSRAAESLGLLPNNLSRKLRELGLREEGDATGG